MQAHPIPYEYINKESSCIFYRSHFLDHSSVFVRFQVLLFCIVKKTLYLLYPFFSGTPGFSGVHWVLGRSKAEEKFKSRPVFINF